jgi:sulfofructose kinase
MNATPADSACTTRDTNRAPGSAAGLGQCSLDYLVTVDRFPVSDTKKEFADFEVQGGGPVATALVVLSRWGVRTRFAGVVCGDRFGQSILEELNREAIDTSATLSRQGRRSQFAFICVERDTGKRTIFWGRPEAEALQPGDIPSGFLEGVQVLHLDGAFMEAAQDLARKARAMGIPVVLDAGSLKPGMLDLIRDTDHLIASETFARQVSQDLPMERLLADLKEMGPDVVTVTLGEKGSVNLWAERPVFLPALPVPVRDTTGAGDVFHGAYIFGLLQGWPPGERLRWATVTAGLSCRSLGGRSGIPDRDCVRSAVAELGPFRELSDVEIS